MKKLLLSVIAVLFLFAPAKAVLKEKDLGHTLTVLRQELEMYQNDSHRSLAMGQAMRAQMQERTKNIMDQSDQIALMLYSQKMDYIFDLTYACNEATQLYNDFNTMRLPFDKVLTKMEVEEARYDGLIDNLQHMPKDMLTQNERKDRDVCLTLCITMKRDLADQAYNLKEYKLMYGMLNERLKTLNDYAIKRYDNIRKSIFVNGDETYFDILSHFGYYFQRAQFSLHEKYSAIPSRTHSQWRGPIVLGWFIFMIFYAIIAVVLNQVVIRFALPKRAKTKEFYEKRSCIILTSTVVTFALVLMILWAFFLYQNFFIMASKLLVQYMWLLAAILLSLLVRLDGKQIKSGFHIYLPMIITGFIVITFRIIFIPNEMVNMIFPMIMLLTTIWQLIITLRRHQNLPKSDMFYSVISLVIMVASVITSWMGYTLLSVQLLVWWMMQLGCIQTITCIYDILTQYEKRHHTTSPLNIRNTWLLDLIHKALVPIILLASFYVSFYWATEVFSLTELCRVLFYSNFIDIAGVARVSLVKIFVVISLFFIVRYIVYIFRSFFILYYGGKQHIVTGEKALLMKVGVVSLWFIFFMVSMYEMRISSSGMLVAMGGLSTGIGFAMKDTLENLFYGISLMTGRLHIGDIIECDGVRGRVVDISYQSTMVETLDGSMIAFLNNQLFSKNFKNLTRNHNFEIVPISVGVAYGTDIERARNIIINAVRTLDCYDKTRELSVIVQQLSESSVTLRVIVWVPVTSKVSATGKIYEAIYKACREAGIEMPFPQQDIHIVEIPEEQFGKLQAQPSAMANPDKK